MSYYSGSKNEELESVQKALEARKKRKETEEKSISSQKETKVESPASQQESYSEVDAALAERKKRLQSTLSSAMSDIENLLTVEIDHYNNTKPSYGTYDTTYESQKERRSAISNLRSKVISYRNYMNADVADKILSTLDQMESGYDAYLSMAGYDTEEDYQTDLRYAGYYQKYGNLSYDEINSKLSGMSAGEERDWLKAYAPSTMTRLDYTLALQKKKGEYGYALALQEEYNHLTDRLKVLATSSKEAQNATARQAEIYRLYGDIDDYVEKLRSEVSELEKAEEQANLWEEISKSYDPVKNYQEGKSGWEKYVSDREEARKENEKRAAEEERKKSDGHYSWEEFMEDVGRWMGPGVNPDSSLPFHIDTQQIAQGYREQEMARRVPDERWTEEQRYTYGYLYAHQSQPLARKYAIAVNNMLDKQQEQEQLQQIAEWATSGFWPGVAHTAGAIVTAPAGLADYLGDVIQAGTLGYIPEADGTITPFEYSQAVTSGIGTHLNTEYGMLNKDIPVIGGKGLGDAYGLGTSILQSAAAANSGGPLQALITFFGSAAASGVDDALRRGASGDQAVVYGTMVGLAEALAEQIGVESLMKIGSSETVKQLIRNILKQGAAEGIEEGVTSILNNFADNLVMVDKSNFNLLVEDYIDKGLDAETAKRKAWLDMAEGIAYDTLGGFVSGFAHAGWKSTKHYIKSQIQIANNGKAIMNADGGLDALKNIANKVAGVTSVDMQNALNEQLGKVNKKATSARVGKLYNTVKAANNQANASANQADIAKSLMRNNFSSEKANALAEALIANHNKQQLTNEQKKLIRSVYYDENVRNAVSNIIDNTKSTMGQRSQNIMDFQSGVYKGLINNEVKKIVRKNTIAKQFTPTVENAPESHYEVSTDGKTIDADGNIVSINGISSIENGRMTLMTEDGNTIDAGDVSYSSQDEAFVYEAVSRLEGIIDTDTANKLSKHLLKLGNVTSDAYVGGIVKAYTYGYYNYGREAMNGSNSLTATLTEEQRNVAYGRGEQYRNAMTAVEQANARKATGKQALQVAEKSSATAPDGTQYQKVRFEGKVKKWGKKQKAEVAYIDFIASNFSGNTVRVFESYKNKDGKYVYEDNNGNIHVAPNGMYIDSTGDIYLDLNAGNHGEGLIMNTFAHELYHHIKRRSPEKARKLAEFLVQELGYESVEQAVQRQIDKAERSGHGVDYLMESGMSRSAAERMVYDRAFNDFVADSLETMFTEGDAIGKLQKLKSQDVGLFNMIKNFIDKWVKKLRQFYSNHSTISIEGDMVRQLEKFEQIQQMFVEALVDAGENYQASLTPGEEGIVVNQNGDPVAHATPDGTVQLSMRTYEENGREAFRAYLQKCVNSKRLTKAEMQEMLDGIEEIYQTCKECKDKYAPFSSWSDAAVVRDTYGKPVFSVVTPNGDYKMNLDFSLVCKKRRTLDAVFNEMSKRGIIDNFELGQKSVVKINEIIRKYGLETACALCFVDAKRFRQASMADSFTRLYNELVESLVPKDQRGSIDHFNFSGYATIKKVDGGIDTWDNSKLDFSHINHVLKTYGDGTVEYKAAKYIKTHAEGRKLLLRGDFMSSQGFDAVKTQNKDILKLYNSKKGTGGPKAAFGDVQYMNEVIQKARWWTPKKAYSVGGIRIQSFSDYVPRMVFDYVQMIYDLAATKLPAHAYTKEALFAKQFGLTGIKINMSLIPAVAEDGIAPGLDANGNYVWAGESFDYETAKEIQNAEGYTENCGTICVGVSYEHILKLLRDPNIRMVIPYHKSGLNPIVAHMNKIAQFHDYTNDQRTKGKDGKALEKDFDFSKALHDMGENASPKTVADQYLKWCAAHGYTPRFAEFAMEENYYKLLEDFTLYDKDGNYVPQREVMAVFPKDDSAFGSMKDLIKAGLEEDAIVEGKRDSRLSAIVDEIQRTIPKTEAEIEETQVEQADRDLEKLADNMENGTLYSDRGSDIKMSDRDTAPTFYSHMARVVDAVKQEKLGAASVVSMLRGKGVKAEEIKWSGIETWLEGKKSVTKAELQEFIAGSMLHIEEATLDGKHKANVEVKKLSKKEYAVFVDGKQVDTLNKGRGGLFSTIISSSKTGEIFDSTDDAVSAYKQKNRHRPKHSAYTLDGGTNYRELLFKLPGSEYSNYVMQVHWGKNAHGILAHARIQDMNTFIGKMLFVEEIQSDWHNEGHKTGYKDVPDAPFKDTYHEYVLKRLLRMAAEEGYDSIGWTTAQTQIERWSEEFSEGYRIEYDQDIPKFLNKYGKKWGTKVGKTTLDNGTEVWSMAITDSMQESVLTEGQPLYSERDTDSVSNRSLLANAFEGIAKPEERELVEKYKANVENANNAQARLNALNQKIKELSFAKGKRDTEKIEELRKTAKDLANLVSKYDKVLLKLEASKPLQDVLSREKKLAYKRAEEKGKQALADYKAKVEAQQKETAEKWRESRKAAVAKARETAEKRDARDKLQKLVLDTVKWISYPSKTDVKCPDILKKPYEAFLQGIDLSSKRLANGGEATKNDLRLANAMDSLATAIDKVMLSQDPSQEIDKVLDIGYLDLPADFVQKLRDMTESIKSMMVEGEYVVNNMTAAEVRKLSQMIRTLNHAIKTMSKLYANLRFANVEALGFDTIDFLDAVGEIEKTGGMKDFAQWDNALPYYAFKRFGKGGESIFEGLMDAQDKLAFLAKDIFDFQEKTWTGKEAKAWSEDTHTIELPNGNKLTLTTADAMSIYCLSRREHALPHLLGGGVRVIGIQKGSKKAKDSRSLLTIKDVEAIISSLTDRQKQVAEGIQEFMSTVCSQWGNEISMKRFLTREFNEKFYFPIESNDENLTVKDPAAQQSDLFRLLNISATKPLTQGANNEVIIRNIFDVFTGHASDMARLNAYGMGLLDYMKWLNYRERGINGEGQINVKGVRKSMEKAYGKAANSYVLNLVKDVNGRASDGGDPTILMKWMRAGKTAAVGNSLRVATLQVTAYPRASMVLSPKSLALGLTKLPKIEMAKKYCGIALWKSFGFYDTNISRSIEDQMKGVTDIKQKLIELSLKGAEWGDAITWGALWNACEYEVAKTTTNKVGSEEFRQEVGKKLREVVYRTQVVDSTLTRSQIMRSKRGMAQEAAAFMSEPTLSANILMDAGFEFGLEKRRSGSVKTAWKKTGSHIATAIAVYSIGQLTAALVEGLWDAWRDDEDEKFWEKYLSAFGENLALDLVPFNKIPIVSDVFEGALAMFGVGFYSSDKMSTTWLTQAVSAVDAWKDVLEGKSSTTAYNALYKTVRAVSSYFGVAFSGVMREGVALWNNTAGAYDTTLKVRQYALSKTSLGNELYDAIISGDTKQADSLKAQFVDKDGNFDPSACSSAIIKALRDNDPRIKDAAIAGYNGDPSERVRIARLIIADGFSQDDVVRAINSEINEMKPDEESTPKKKGFYTTEDFAVEIANGDQAAANAAKADVIATAQENGKSEEDAEDSFVSSATSNMKKLFLDDKLSKDKAVNALITYCGKDNEGANEIVAKWQFESEYGFTYGERKQQFLDGNISAAEIKSTLMSVEGKTEKEANSIIVSYSRDAYSEGYFDRNEAATIMVSYGGLTKQEAESKLRYIDVKKQFPDTYVDDAWVDEYYSEVKSSGISINVFVDYRNKVKGITGEGKKEKRMAVINSLPITRAQKDALYYAEGWTASKLHEAPWH